MARLVAATCPKCGAHVQLDPDREFVTCQYCGASSFIQTQKRPVTQQIVAQQVPVIHVPHAQKGCAGALVLLSVLGGVGAAIAGVVMSLITTATTVVPQLGAGNAPAAPATAAAAAAGGGDATPAPATPSGPLVEEDYFADAAKVKARYEAQLGKPVMAKELVVYQYYAILEAQNPKNPAHVDSFKLWANKVERPQPVRLGSDKNQLGALLFSLDTVDFTLLPRVIKQALAELRVEDGKVTHVILERDSSGSRRDPIWRVYVNGSRESGFVEYSLAGEKRRVAN